jgi:ADP-ribosylglycohydrolase
MSEALMRAYSHAHDHLDAYGFRDFMVPEVTRTVVWVPERQREMAIIGRLNPMEHYSVFRLTEFGAWPWTAGAGGAQNDGVAMWIMPAGAVNAGAPLAAWREAVSLGTAEADSHSVEAAGTLAAAYAAAFQPDSTVESVLAAVMSVLESGPGRQAGKGAYHDDTLAALRAVLRTVDPTDSYERFANKAWTAIAPFSHDAVEEIPIALAAFRYGNGDFLRTLRASVLYGRDADSIAGMACGLVGATQGLAAIPAELRSASDQANRRDFAGLAADFNRTVMEIMAKDRERWNQRVAATR